MIEKTFGRSGYRLKHNSPTENIVQLWTLRHSIMLNLSIEEAEQLVDDIKEEFFGDRRHSD